MQIIGGVAIDGGTQIIAPASTSSIVTSGLAVHLDAGNPSSYPGTGVVWTSLVNGYTANLISGAAYSSNSGGVITFNGSTSYVDMYNTTVPASSLASTTLNNFSVEAWYKSNNNFPAIIRTGVSSRGFVFGYYSGTGTAWKVTKYGVIDLQAGTIPQNNAWHQAVVTYSSTAGVKVYIDGSLSGSVANNTNLGAGNEFSIGKSENVNLNGNMGIFRWYNSVLSASDVLQNFNANRTRYGL
jgi:Concanavalin A-like lectin/glucanases superfamily